MKSFQNKNRGCHSLQTRKCIHGRYSLTYFKHGNKKSCKQIANLQDKNTNVIKIQPVVPDDPKTTMMKSIIAINEDYFQNKLQVSNSGKPNKEKLKIPSKTGFTIYKRDYIKNSQSQAALKNLIPNFKQNKIQADFFGNTTYRHEFLGQQNEGDREKRKIHQSVDPDAPFFLQSQYKHNYLNWGGGNHMPSMKPDPAPAVTNLPFQTSSVYATQFTNKPHHKVQCLKPNNSFVSFNTNNNGTTSQISSPLCYMTTNNLFYDKKNNSKQNSLKPKNQTLKVGGNIFKGRTEYQSQFINMKSSGILEPSGKKPLGELQNMIINL